ncbi:MAG: sugar kinase [Verrucomicrobiota bacterium]|nr:sugar kinase [Verrucomicrobiota bacterium]
MFGAPMPAVVTFGEIMLRLTPPGCQRFAQAPCFEITFGGAEANVAVTLAQLGAPADFVTRLPENEIAQRAIDELRGLGVGVDKIRRGGDRMGVYFLETGASQRSGKVIYDRAHSALAEAKPGDFDWETIFRGAAWFHWSGITPALSGSAAALTAEACAAARRLGLQVSFDMNFRAKLWTTGQAHTVLAPLMPHVDLCCIGSAEARQVFGIEGASEAEIAAGLMARFGCKMIAMPQRSAASASQTGWGATLFSAGNALASRRYEITIVDRVGAGDSFTGALLFSLRRGDDLQRAIDFAVAASCLKHTIPGDYNLVSLAEVEALAGGGDGGRVQR